MTDKTFHLIVGIIFAVIALMQLLRIVLGWSVVVDGWNAPMWISVVAVLVAGVLSYLAFIRSPQ